MAIAHVYFTGSKHGGFFILDKGGKKTIQEMVDEINAGRWKITRVELFE